MLLIWQHILPLATHTACWPMRELGLVMDTRRGLNNVNRAFHFIDRPRMRTKTSETSVVIFAPGIDSGQMTARGEGSVLTKRLELIGAPFAVISLRGKFGGLRA